MLRFVTCESESGWWGHDLFVDDSGNEYLLTAYFKASEGHNYRVTDEEANAIAAELGVK